MNLAIKLAPAPGRPEEIGDFRRRLEEILRSNPRKFLELHGAQMLPRWQRRHVIPRREGYLAAWGRVAAVVLERHDLVSSRVGVPRSDGTVSGPGQLLTTPEGEEYGIAVDADVSLSQCRRILQEMVSIGYLLGPSRVLGPDGKWRWKRNGKGRAYQHVEKYTDAVTGKVAYHAYRAVYVIADLFFARLGKDMVKKRARARQRLGEHRRARAQRVYAPALIAGQKVRRAMKAGSRETRAPNAPGAPTEALGGPPRPEAPRTAIDAHTNAQRVLQAVMLGLRNKHPDWGPERIRAEAERLTRAGTLTDS